MHQIITDGIIKTTNRISSRFSLSCGKCFTEFTFDSNKNNEKFNWNFFLLAMKKA